MEPDAVLDEIGVPIDAIELDSETSGGHSNEYFSGWCYQKASEEPETLLEDFIDEEVYTTQRLQKRSIELL